MWIHGSEPSSFDLTHATGNSGVNNTYLALGHFGSAGQVDEIRVGKSWADVTPVRELARLIDFDVAGDLDYFSEVDADPVTGGTYTWSSGTGVGGASGRVDTVVSGTDWNSLFYGSSLDITDGRTLETSVFFQAEAGSNDDTARVVLGVEDEKINLNQNAEIQVRLLKHSSVGDNKFQAQIRYNAGLTSAFGSPITLTDDDWYRLILNLTQTATTNVFDVEAAVEHWGNDGLTFQSTLASTSTQITNTAGHLWGDQEIWVGMLMQNDGGGAKAIDNFHVNIIPEPSTLALLAIAGLGMLMLARRRRRR